MSTTMKTVQDLLVAGAAHHTAGRLAEAERHYRQVLSVAPMNSDAWHLLGVLASAVGKPAVAERLIRLALALQPDLPAAWYNLGNAHRRLERGDRALAAFRRALALNPSSGNRDIAAIAHAERAAALAGGVGALNKAFNVLHRRNRDEPSWRGDTLLAMVGAERRAEILAHVEEALRLDSGQEPVRHIAMLVFVAIGDLERGLEALGPPDGDGNAEFSRLAAEVAWYLRRAGEARAHYEAFIRRKCQGEAPLKPLLAEVAQAPAFAGRPRGPFAPEQRPVLIYTHYGNPDFLHHSIGQSLVSNPGARIILIGDRENRIDGVEHHRIQDYAAAARAVVGRYFHDSNNAYCYELFCIARWFLFLDLFRREGIGEAFLLDSDYMLFTGLAEEAARCRPLGLGFSTNSAHFSYFTLDGLAAFCEHIAAFFQRGDDTGDFHRRNNSTLFSDMAFIFDFQRAHAYRNFCALEDGRRFDYSITDAEGFRSTGGIKDIHFEDGLPYALPEAGGPPVRFLGLHFQGLTKPMMRRAFFRQSWGDAVAASPPSSPETP